MSELALFGGEKTRKEPFGRGRRFGEEELNELREALEQNTLFYWSGSKVKKFAAEFAEMYGAKYCVTSSSGSASIHIGLAAAGVGPGDEVITSPVTDMGSIIGILYQNAIPVFADIDPYTYNMDPASIESKITDKTKAIEVVHLAGNPADMDAIMDIARRHGIKVVEDCSQSYECYYKGKLAGTIGDIGCYSLNDFKHISTGEGGAILTDNEEMYRFAFKFADKNYDRISGDPNAMRKVAYLAPNYRMNELQGAVALAQLHKLKSICDSRRKIGEAITAGISGLPGIHPHKVLDGCKSSFNFYMFRVDEKLAGVNRNDFSKALSAEGITNQPGYIPACVYEYDLFKTKTVYPGSDCPFGCKHYGREIKYETGMCPTAEEVLDTGVRMGVSEFYTERDAAVIVEAIRKVADYYRNRA